jgi:predicted AlkP superfamily pyrophosphatase or phosphodiesterase
MHAADLALYVRNNPSSVLARLSQTGVTFTNARTPLLGDSTPGLLSMTTGAPPGVAGLIYSPFYDRTLSAPGSDCSARGTVYFVDEKWIKDNTREDSGGGIVPEKLARDPSKGCSPVYPHQLLRVNTVFEIVKKARGRTAWIDQHLMYTDMLYGPSGSGLDEGQALERGGTPYNLAGVIAQDNRRTGMLLNQIRGLDSTGTKSVGVPKLFGLGFISVGVMQKTEGYQDAEGTPGDGLKSALDSVDQSMGRIVSELERQTLLGSTMIIISSKHGQSPIDISRRRPIDRALIRGIVEGVKPGLLAHASLDTIGLIYLKEAGETKAVAEALREKQKEAGIQKIYWGEPLNLLLDSPAADPRAPDIIIQPQLGVIYMDEPDGPKAKLLLAEHGGMLGEDTHVPLLVVFAGAKGTVNKALVQTNQIAPTILTALGLDPNALDAVRLQGTPALPGILDKY